MKILKEQFPYRFVEVVSDLRIEKYDPVVKKYKKMYTCGCEMQMLTAMEDLEYAKWLCQDPCYLRDIVVSPYK